MKIGIESQRIFRRQKHGMDVVALELIRQLQVIDKRNNYTLFARDGEDRGCVEETSNFRIRRIRAVTYGDWEQISLPRAVKRMQPDVLHCTANTGPLIGDVPIILTLHDIIFLQETNFKGSAYQNFGNVYRRLVVPQLMKKAAMIITVSEEEKKIIASSCNIDPAKLRVVYNGVHERFAQNFPDHELQVFREKYNLPARYILHLGNTAPKKNTQRMIHAYAEYASSGKDTLPMVVADYPLHLVQRALAEVKQQSIIEKIHLPGYIPSGEMPLLYRSAAVFVYPSLFESFGLPVLEAMAGGIPVITSAIPALKEVGGNVATYIDPSEVSSITSAIIDVLKDGDKSGMRTGERRERAAMFSWRKSAEKLLRIYEEVANKNGRN